jgi:zinc transporter
LSEPFELLENYNLKPDDYNAQGSKHPKCFPRVTRYVETLNDIRDRAQIINEEIDKLNSAKLNSMTYMFSVAATIFLPLTFLTGLLGSEEECNA